MVDCAHMPFVPSQETVASAPPPLESVVSSESPEQEELDEHALAEQKAVEEAKTAEREKNAPQESAFLEENVATDAPVDPLLKDIEKILAIDLDGVFKDLAEEVKTRFLQEGQDLAHRVVREKISLSSSHVVEWVEKWLHQIPNVNKIFLKQDAKIKTDMILRCIKDAAPSSP